MKKRSHKKRKGVRSGLHREYMHLFRYALTLSRNHADAEDLLHSTVERALAREEQFTAGTSLRRWLFTIMRNRHIDNMRRHKVRGHMVEPADWQEPMQTRAVQQEKYFADEVTTEIKALNSGEREVMVRSAIKGQPHSVIADALDIPEGTVKSRLWNARKNLRDRLRHF